METLYVPALVSCVIATICIVLALLSTFTETGPRVSLRSAPIDGVPICRSRAARVLLFLAAWCESRAHRPSLRSRVARIGRQLRARTLRAMVRAIGIRATLDAATARTLRRWLDRQARKSARALDRARDRATLAQIAIDHPAAW